MRGVLIPVESRSRHGRLVVPNTLQRRRIEVLEYLRDLLRELEREKTLSTDLHERVLEARLRADREIEALRS